MADWPTIATAPSPVTLSDGDTASLPVGGRLNPTDVSISPGSYTLSEFRVFVSTHAGDPQTVDLRVNGTVVNQTVSVTATGTFVDTTNTDSVTAGQTVDLINLGGMHGDDIAIASAQVMWTSASIGPPWVTNTVPAVSFHAFTRLGAEPEADSEYVFREARVLSDAYLAVSNHSVNGTWTTRKNGAAGNISISVTGDGTFSDTTNTDSYAVGDTGCWEKVSGSYFAEEVAVQTDGETSVIGAQSPGTSQFAGWGSNNGVGTEAWTEVYATEAVTINNLTAYCDAHGGTNRTIQSRVNGANGNQSITATGTGRFADTTNTDALTDGDRFTLDVGTTSGTSFTLVTVEWGEAAGGGFSITGAITVPITVAATTAFTWTIAGAVTVATTIAAATSFTARITGDVTVPVTVAATTAMTETIAGDVTVPITVAATTTIAKVLAGDVTVPITIAAVTDYTFSRQLAGDVTVPITIAATTAVSRTIAGDVTVPITVASGTAITYRLTGDVTVPITIAAATTVAETITGDVTVPITIAANMQFAGSFSINGDVTVPITVAATTAIHETIAGAVTVPITIAATTAVSRSLSGAVTVPITVAADTAFTSTIAGDVTVPITVAATTTISRVLSGDVTVPITVAATMTFTGGDSIVGDVTVPITIAAVTSFTSVLVGDVTVPITVAASMTFSGVGLTFFPPTGSLQFAGRTPNFAISSIACSEVLVHVRTIWEVTYSDDPNFLNPIATLDTTDPLLLRRVTFEGLNLDIGREITARATIFDNCGCLLQDEGLVSPTIPPAVCPPVVFDCPDPVGEASWVQEAFVEADWDGDCIIDVPICPPGVVQTFTVPAGLVGFQGFSPTFSVPTLFPVPRGQLAFQGFPPSFATGEVIVAPPAGSLNLSGQTPTFSTHFKETTVPVGALTLTGTAPSFDPGVVINVSAGILTITTFTPDFPLNDTQVPSPVGSVGFQGFAPTFSVVGVPLYEDDFESGDLDDMSDQFSWGGHGGNVNVVHRDDMVEAEPVSGDYALEFFFRDSFQISAELRFFFDESRYVALEYELYVPSNFVHQDDPTHSLDNNKFLALWDGAYDVGLTQFIEYVRSGTDSRLRFLDGGSSEPEDFDAIVDPLISDSGPIVRGQWNQIRIEFQASSSSTTNDGLFRMWVNGVVIVERLNQNYWDESGSVYDRGYLFGAANAGFVEDTYFYIDNFKIWITDPDWEE